MNVREEVSAILGVRIEPNGWDRAWSSIDKAGMMTKRKQMDLILMVLKRLEAQENDGREEA